MSPKLTPDMIAKASKQGAVVKKALPRKAKQKAAPAPAPQQVDFSQLDIQVSSLIKALKEQVSAMQAQLNASNRQNTELRGMVETMMTDKPVRLKVRRDMDRQSPTYLLMEHLDVIPVEYRRLDS